MNTVHTSMNEYTQGVRIPDGHVACLSLSHARLASATRRHSATGGRAAPQQRPQAKILQAGRPRPITVQVPKLTSHCIVSATGSDRDRDS